MRVLQLAAILIFIAAPATLLAQNVQETLKVERSVKREFYKALREGDTDKAIALIKSGKIPLELRNKFNWTPLFYAADSNDVKLAKFLLGRGANVNARDYFGITPLHQATIRGSYDVAKLLIEKGADVNARDKYGYTPLHLAAIYNRVRMAKLLIEKGANINARDNYGNTPLHYCATTKGTYSVAKLLLEKGANPNVKNKRGKTPLELAQEAKNYRIARLLSKFVRKEKHN